MRVTDQRNEANEFCELSPISWARNSFSFCSLGLAPQALFFRLLRRLRTTL